MKNLYRAMLTALMLAPGVMCQGQSNVYSIDGISADSFLPAPHGPDEMKIWSSTYSGSQNSQVEWYVSTNTLAKQPHWENLADEVPLSPRKACALALPHVQERLPHVKSWSVESVLLCKPYQGERGEFPDVWYYQITFRPRAPEDRVRPEYKAEYYVGTQIVLLDGTVVPQTVLKKK